MSRNRPRNPETLGLGLILLSLEMTHFGWNDIPPVTLSAILGQVLLFLDVLRVPWDKWDVCLSGTKVWDSHEYHRLVLSTLEHGDDMHLYFNMGSLLLKGSFLEKKYRSTNFAILVMFLGLTTSAIYVGLALVFSTLSNDSSVMESCAIGFSGVLFALKVVTTQESKPGYLQIDGLMFDSRYAPWLELVAIHLTVANASFMGHLAGILAGLIYTKTFFGSFLDAFIQCVTGRTVEHDIYYYNLSETNYSSES